VPAGLVAMVLVLASALVVVLAGQVASVGQVALDQESVLELVLAWLDSPWQYCMTWSNR